MLVEGGKIDLGHHEGVAKKALSETVSMSEAVQTAVDTTKKNTLITVTADHSHTMSIGGYGTSRGNPILGLSDTTAALPDDNKPYTTLLYASGPGAKIDGVRDDISNVDIEANDYKQQSVVPLKLEPHGGEDVPIYARGPMSALFHGVQQQNYIAHALAYASCVGAYKDRPKC